jgi:glucose-fructose oxidoreductase
LKDEEPGPSGREGLADIRIIRALYQSAQKNKAIKLAEFEPGRRPSAEQQMARPGVDKPKMINAKSPSGGN